MTSFHPSNPFVLTSVKRGGISGKVSYLTIRRDEKKYSATIGNYSMNTPLSLSEKQIRALEDALKKIDWSSLPAEDGSQGYDLSIWSLVLAQGNHEWRFSVRSERVAHYRLDGLYTLLSDLIEGHPSR